jgi:hypothetical protein
MWNLNDLRTIKYLRPYVYAVEFDDRTKGEVDLSYLLMRGPIFKPLRNIKFFRSARIQGGTIAWPNGADLAPETLYEAVQNQPTLDSAGRAHSRRR